MIGEESMLWSAIFLDVLEHGTKAPALLSPPITVDEAIAAEAGEADLDTDEAAAA
jgi:hypothetical protein